MRRWRTNSWRRQHKSTCCCSEWDSGGQMGLALSWSWRWISSWLQWGSKHQNRNQLWSSSILLDLHSRTILKLRRYAAWSPPDLAEFTTGEVFRSRLVEAQSEQSLLSSLFASSFFIWFNYSRQLVTFYCRYRDHMAKMISRYLLLIRWFWFWIW